MTRPMIALLLSAAPALAGEPGPVCGQKPVLRLVAETLQRAGQPAWIEPGSVGEAPGPRPGLVNCAVRVHRPFHDTNARGRLPLETVSVYQYTLELRRNGVFLQPAL